MKKILLVLLIAIFTTSLAFAGNVKGYYRSNGTYVQPYQRSSPNYTVRDNYSYKGNYNPNTGQQGTNYNRNNPTSGYYGTSNTNVIYRPRWGR